MGAGGRFGAHRQAWGRHGASQGRTAGHLLYALLTWSSHSPVFNTRPRFCTHTGEHAPRPLLRLSAWASQCRGLAPGPFLPAAGPRPAPALVSLRLPGPQRLLALLLLASDAGTARRQNEAASPVGPPCYRLLGERDVFEF